MPLDPLTLLLIDILIVFLVSVAYGVVWLENRDEPALLWMLGASLIAGCGLVTRFTLPLVPAIVVSNALLGTGICATWMSCRVLRGARPKPLLLVLPTLAWVSAAFLPGFATALSARVVGANCMIGCFFALAAWEIWQLETQRRVVRISVCGLLAVQAAVNLLWAVINFFFPAGQDANFLTMPGIATFNLSTLIFSLLMTMGLIVLVRERAMADYRQIALLDAVTGVANRRAFDEALLQAVGDARRRPVALVMADIDSFKSYNDRYGHIEGDRCLHAVAQTLAAALPRGSRVFRYGGEEFALLLSGMTIGEAVVATEALRVAVRRLAIAHGGREGGIVTISQGVASQSMSGDRPVAEVAHSLLSAADRALYRAKREGRDRVVAAGSSDADAVVIGRIAS